jgi:hypothetical protein
MDIHMTPPDELTRLRFAMELILQDPDLPEACRLIAAKALEPPPPSPKPPMVYEEARTLADLDTHAWLIVGWQIGDKHGYTIPDGEIATFQRLRDDGLLTSAQARRGDQTLILARLLRDVPEARPTSQRRTSVAAP